MPPPKQGPALSPYGQPQLQPYGAPGGQKKSAGQPRPLYGNQQQQQQHQAAPQNPVYQYQQQQPQQQQYQQPQQQGYPATAYSQQQQQQQQPQGYPATAYTQQPQQQYPSTGAQSYPTAAADPYAAYSAQPSANPYAAAAAGAQQQQQPAAPQSAKRRPRPARQSNRPVFSMMQYLRDKGYTEDDVALARGEHAQRQLALGCDTSVFEKEYGGHGVRMFFEFVKYFFAIYFVLMVLQIIVFSTASANETNTGKSRFRSESGRPWYYGFFISDFTADDNDAWMALNIICFIIAFAMAPMYVVYVGQRWSAEEERLKQKKQAAAMESMSDASVRTDMIVRLLNSGHIDVSHHYRGHGDLFLRRCVSLIAFIGCLVIQIIISILLTESDDGSFIVSLVIAGVAALVDVSYNFIATLLTEFEKHVYNSAALRWLGVKIMLFKVANIMAVYGARSYRSNGRCVYEVIGQQVMSLWLVEMFIIIPGTIIGNMVWARKFQLYAELTGSISGDKTSLPPFQLAREYLKLLYLGFLSYAGMVVMPLSLCLGFVGIAVQYWSAKFRLCKLCGEPLKVEASQRFLVFAGLLLAALAGLLTPNAGGVWVMSGDVRSSTNSTLTCALPA